MGRPTKTKVVLRVEFEVEQMDPDDEISEGEMALAGKEAVENALAKAQADGWNFDYMNVLSVVGPAKVEFARGKDITEP
jgi:hypothetical protein